MIQNQRVFLYPGSTAAYRRWLQERAEAPEDPEIDGQIRELKLTLTRLMAEEAPEEEEERKALQSRIDRIQARLDQLKSKTVAGDRRLWGTFLGEALLVMAGIFP